MLTKRKRVFYLSLYSLIFVLLVTAAVVVILWFFSPRTIFERNFGIELPKSAEVTDYKYTLVRDKLILKVKLDTESYTELAEQLPSLGWAEYIPDDIITYMDNCTWWNVKEEDIILGYIRNTGKRFLTQTVPVRTDIYITQDANGQFYLYVSCIE